MTNILEERLREEVGSWGVINPTFYVYGGYERLGVILPDKRLLGSHFSNDELVVRIAREVFVDVPHKVGPMGDFANIVYFEPGSNSYKDRADFDYQEFYSGHLIEVPLGEISPTLNFHTGNRGRVELHPVQRDKYFEFVRRIHEAFVDEVKNKKS